MINNKVIEPSLDRAWHELYIALQADPTDHRSDKKFCEDIALEYQTLASWKKKFRSFIFREVEARRRNHSNELRAMMYKALAKKLDKDTNAIKLLAQLLGDLVEKTEVKTESMNDADKVRRIKALSEVNSRKLTQWNKASDSSAAIGPSETDGPNPSEPSRPKPPTVG